jgi:hypothetical protein
LLAIFREIHQVQGFIDFDRGKFGLETGGYRYQIFTVGSPRPSQSDNLIYATREDAERAGEVAAAILLKE